jgi:hypothetical protein
LYRHNASQRDPSDGALCNRLKRNAKRFVASRPTCRSNDGHITILSRWHNYVSQLDDRKPRQVNVNDILRFATRQYLAHALWQSVEQPFRPTPALQHGEQFVPKVCWNC